MFPRIHLRLHAGTMQSTHILLLHSTQDTCVCVCVHVCVCVRVHTCVWYVCACVCSVCVCVLESSLQEPSSRTCGPRPRLTATCPQSLQVELYPTSHQEQWTTAAASSKSHPKTPPAENFRIRVQIVYIQAVL